MDTPSQPGPGSESVIEDVEEMIVLIRAEMDKAGGFKDWAYQNGIQEHDACDAYYAGYNHVLDDSPCSAVLEAIGWRRVVTYEKVGSTETTKSGPTPG